MCILLPVIYGTDSELVLKYLPVIRHSGPQRKTLALGLETLANRCQFSYCLDTQA